MLPGGKTTGSLISLQIQQPEDKYLGQWSFDRLSCSTLDNHLFGNGGKALGGVLRPHVKNVKFSLQRRGHQLVHVNVLPVKLHTAYLLRVWEKKISGSTLQSSASRFKREWIRASAEQSKQCSRLYSEAFSSLSIYGQLWLKSRFFSEVCCLWNCWACSTWEPHSSPR